MQFPRLKVIVKDINEIWSLDLAYVDNLAKYNRDVKYLLVAVDCLSRYLRVESMKAKCATEAANAFRKCSNINNPRKYGLMMEQNFSEISKDCATHEQFIYIAFLVKKDCFCRTEYSFTEKYHS